MPDLLHSEAGEPRLTPLVQDGSWKDGPEAKGESAQVAPGETRESGKQDSL